MALGFSFPSFPPSLSFFISSPLLDFLPDHSDGLHIVGGQHALLAGALHAAVHPAFVDLLHVYDQVSVHERHLVVICGSVVVHCSVPLLWAENKAN